MVRYRAYHSRARPSRENAATGPVVGSGDLLLIDLDLQFLAQFNPAIEGPDQQFAGARKADPIPAGGGKDWALLHNHVDHKPFRHW